MIYILQFLSRLLAAFYLLFHLPKISSLFNAQLNYLIHYFIILAVQFIVLICTDLSHIYLSFIIFVYLRIRHRSLAAMRFIHLLHIIALVFILYNLSCLILIPFIGG